LSKEKDNKETSIESEVEVTDTQENSTETQSEEISEIDKLKEEVAQWEDKFLRTHASFENSKRLLAKDKERAVAYANESFASDILSVVDSLDSALSMINNVDIEKTDTNEFFKKMKEGLELVDEQLHKVLDKNHIKPISCDKEYDPNVHQAIMQVESDEHESGQIVQVMQKGYTIKDRVLRPAMVSTAK